jgi:hypothetical protein
MALALLVSNVEMIMAAEEVDVREGIDVTPLFPRADKATATVVDGIAEIKLNMGPFERYITISVDALE